MNIVKAVIKRGPEKQWVYKELEQRGHERLLQANGASAVPSKRV